MRSCTAFYFPFYYFLLGLQFLQFTFPMKIPLRFFRLFFFTEKIILMQFIVNVDACVRKNILK